MIADRPEVNGAPSGFFCPACNHTLWQKKVRHKVAIYCPHFACSDSRMNDGAVGRSLAEAFRKLVKKSGGLVLLLLLLIGCAVPGLNRFGRLEYKGQVIYRFEQPDTNALHTLRALGVAKIVNLSNAPQPWEKAYVEALGMVYVSIPLCGVLAPTAVEEEIVQQNLDNGPQPVGVHCAEGKDRTGTAIACWEIRRGLDAKTAREEADRWGLSVGAMRRFIESYRP
jgi:protein tyrosine phosphatase (PTP) superfamily phosphohydrolase (DUF442 family)